MSLFVCGDPGSRLSTIYTWLTNNLTYPCFEPGVEFKNKLNYDYRHTDFKNKHVAQSNDFKVRIRPVFEKLNINLYLFLVKCVYNESEGFSRNQFDLETFTKCSEEAKFWFYHNEQIDENQYDYVLDFCDTFNMDVMVDLYKKFNSKEPDDVLIKNLDATNKLNNITLDKNHACNISAMVLQKENELGFKESQRFWSAVDIYSSVDQHELYDTIYNSIREENYGTLLPLPQDNK